MQSREFRDLIERVKLRSPIEVVVGERVEDLQRRGSAWKARCPFHQEKTPSFTVNPERGTWHCFGACNEGGDVISFIERYEGLEFIDALRLLAQACGETIPTGIAPRRGGAEAENEERLFEGLERAQKLYARILFQPEGAEALAYARGRGLTDDCLKEFGLGFSPRQGNPVLDAARKVGFSEDALVEAGLAKRTDEGRTYDFFRGRLLIPIRDRIGRTVGFGGRKLPTDELSDGMPGAKYVNTAETPLFKKSRLIYGLDRARDEVRRSKHLVLMEGYTDVMAAHQVGIQNTAAVLGTATTEDHAHLVRRSGARRVTLVFDGDEAGLRAGLRAVEHLLPLGLELDVSVLAEGTDPCDLCIEGGADAFRAVLDGARDWYEHALGLLDGLSGPSLAEEVDEILKLLLMLKKPVERDLRVAQMARHLGLPEEGIRAQGRELVKRRRSRAKAPSVDSRPIGERANGAPPNTEIEAQPDPRLREIFRGFLGATLLDNSLIPGIRVHRPTCPEGLLTKVFDAILELYDEGDEEAPIDAAAVLTALGDDPARDEVVPLAERAKAAESPEILARDQVRALEQRSRESEVDRLQNLHSNDTFEDSTTRDALQALHEVLRGIKVPSVPASSTPPQTP